MDGLSLGSIDLSGLLGDQPPAQDDSSAAASSPSFSDAAQALGVSALQAVGQNLQTVAGNYFKTWNPTTGSLQATGGNTPTGGLSRQSNVLVPGDKLSFMNWVQLHPIASLLGGLGLLFGAGLIWRAATKK